MRDQVEVLVGLNDGDGDGDGERGRHAGENGTVEAYDAGASRPLLMPLFSRLAGTLQRAVSRLSAALPLLAAMVVPRRRQSARCMAVGFMVGAALFLILLSGKTRHYISYGTRPLWDTPEKPWKVIPRVYSEDLSMADLCALHGWSELETPRRVFDAVLFSVELDLLEIRLMELLPVVTKFLIVESNTTFTGIPKPLHFQDNRSRFAFAEDKIEYATVPGRTLQKGEDPFDLEKQQRAAMNALFDKLRGRGELRDGDVVIMADVDEIPARETSQLLQSCDGLPHVLHLGMRNYIYSFDFMVDTDHWRAKAHVVAPKANGLLYSHSRASDVLLVDAGWHCSFCFRRLSDFVFKMTGYSHADRARGADALDAQRIQRVVCDGSDIFGMMPEAHSFKDLVWKWGPTKPLNSLVNVPRHLVAGARLGRFKFLLPGGCIREP